MYLSELYNGAYRIVRDDALVVAEVTGNNQYDPASNQDGSIVTWASYVSPRYVVCTRTVNGNTLGPIIQQSANTDEHAIHPFLAGNWLLWTQCRNDWSVWAKNIVTNQIIGPWVTSPMVGGCWAWSANANHVFGVCPLHWGKNYSIAWITGIMFDLTAGQFMSFNGNPDVLVLAGITYPGGVLLRNPDLGTQYSSYNGDVITIITLVNGSGFDMTVSLAQHDASRKLTAYELWHRTVDQNGIVGAATLLQSVPVQYDGNGQSITEVPSWL